MPIGLPLADGTVTHTLKRSDLYEGILAATARRGIGIEHGKRLVAAEPTGTGGVRARFADGSTAEGDLLIGADGVHSTVRKIIDPGAPSPDYTGLGNIGGFSGRIDTGIDVSRGAYMMVFGKRCFFGYTITPGGEVWWFGNPPRAQEYSREELAAISPKQWQQRMIDLLGVDNSPAVRIVSAAEPFRYTNQYELPTVPSWHRGPMLIIGDAAHAVAPSSGQGVSMAAEDAVTLAKCLRDLPNVETAFTTYERLRRDRVQRVVAFGARGSKSKQLGPVGRTIRDLMLPFVMKREAKPDRMNRQVWLFKHRIDWDTPVQARQAI